MADENPDNDTTKDAEPAAPADADPGATPAEDAAAAATGEDEEDEEDEDLEPPPSPRIAVSVALPVVSAAIMIGGIFRGASPRFFCAIAGLLGVALAFYVAKLRKPLVANLLIAAGLFAIGLLMVIPGGPADVGRVGQLARVAAEEGGLLRPPVPFTQGWHAISGWLMGIIGFAAAWVALAVRRPSIALLIPLPFAAFAGISVPDSQQVASGLSVLVLFAIGLGILSSEQSVGEGDERPPIGYEVRKAVKALPLIGAIVGLLAFLAQTDFLFPPPVIDPTKEPQTPKTVPISEVEDRELFQVTSTISGPWRMGTLDVYDADDFNWKLPPFAENELAEVPDSGVVNNAFNQGVRAEFDIRGLGGAVLPGLPNTVGILASGLESGLQYDDRSGNIRLSDGQVAPGQTYTVVAASLPSVSELKRVAAPLPPEVDQFVEIPDPPPAVQALLTQVFSEFDNDWARFDFLRTYVLDEVVATGLGTPVAISPERVQEVLGGTFEASPYEIVAMQAMLARWAGVPSRIGYGFDGGAVIEAQTLSVRPENGASFPEVFFPGFGWLPVIGTPRQAEPSVGGDPDTQRLDPTVVPSDDIGVEVFVPILVPPDSVAARQIAVILLVVGLIALVVFLTYVLWPGVQKARLRSRRRAAALAAGPRARVALAYAEWRDFATDFGFRFPTDTPLMFIDRFIADDEHTEAAWLTTRVLWGDLQRGADGDTAAAAEELSRSLRRRLAASQPSTLRAVAAVSRLSMKDPYAPRSDVTQSAIDADAAKAAAHRNGDTGTKLERNTNGTKPRRGLRRRNKEAEDANA